MKPINDRERIMNTMGTLKDLIDDFNVWVEVEGFYADEIDKTFSIGLQRFINDIDTFHRSWEDRYE